MTEPTPILTVDLDAPIPVYRQILDGLRAFLVSGVFEPGERLPTVRALAGDLGVNHNTVAQAYRSLADEGWLELARGRGATVRDRRQPPSNEAATEGFVRRLQGLVAEALASGAPREQVAGELEEAARRIDGRPLSPLI